MSDPIKQSKLIALRAVMKPTVEDSIRKIFRWYSKTFSTPLHEVDDLPLTDVLVVYFEEQFEEMEPGELEHLRRVLTRTAHEQKQIEAEEDEAEADGMDLLREMEEEARTMNKKQKQAPAPPEFSMDFSDLKE